MEFNPSPSTVLNDGDHLIVLGSSPDAERAGTGGADNSCLREYSTGPRSPARSEASCRRARPRLRAAPAGSPGLSIVLVGDKPDSQIYVNSKLKSAGDEGMNGDAVASAGIDVARRDPVADRHAERGSGDRRHSGAGAAAGFAGPAAMQQVFDAIDPSKDVDGVTPANVGRLVQNRADLVACTPAGIIELLRRSGIEIAGKHAVVIGRSDIVGKPVSMLLLHRHATVTVCHSRTQDLAGDRRDRPTSSSPRSAGPASCGDRSSSRARRSSTSASTS